jgi:excinuclease ABC subunit C
MESLKKTIRYLPKLPGVYQFIGYQGEVLYIGKAKNLKNRVASYFTNKKHESYKTKTLVKQVKEIRHIVVENESDALLLENNLIKKIQPKYNVLLKDDKTFPWICIKNEPFPKVFSTRRIIKDGSEYFGPYTSAYMVKTLLNLVRQLYQIRTCNLNLSPDNIKKKKYKLCLEYHIGNCLGPCEGLQTEDDYNQSIQQIKKILKGNLQDVIFHLHSVMNNFSAQQKFEEAEKIKQKMLLLERYKSKSTIVNPKLNNIDVFSFIDDEKRVFINFLKIMNGAVIQSHTVELHRKLDERQEELLMFGIIDIREKVNSDAYEIIVPFIPNKAYSNIKFIVPQRGDKKKLLDLSVRNAKLYKHQRNQILESKNYDSGRNKLLEKAQSDLRLKNIPHRIECFDNSNIQGTHPVASCVVFLDGKPAKKEYRYYNIKSVRGANDFASMEEVIERRYKRQINEKSELPDLIIIDGGKGQLHSAGKSLQKLSLADKIPAIGIAKKLERIYFPNDPVPVYLDKKSSTLKLIQNIRNEAHRFGINFHRRKRSSAMIKNSLVEITGIGEKTAEKILRSFHTMDELKSKSLEEIEMVVGRKMGMQLFKAIHKSN